GQGREEERRAERRARAQVPPPEEEEEDDRARREEDDLEPDRLGAVREEERRREDVGLVERRSRPVGRRDPALGTSAVSDRAREGELDRLVSLELGEVTSRRAE